MLKKVPSTEIVEKLLHCFGLENLYDNHYISKSILKLNNTVSKITEILPEIEVYYLPCKISVYLTNLNENKCLTMLKHFIRPYNYVLKKKEVVEKNKKRMLYCLSKIETKYISIKKIDRVILF
jgi:hypothetical protein